MNLIPKMHKYCAKEGTLDILELGRFELCKELASAESFVKEKLDSRIKSLGGKGDKKFIVYYDKSVKPEGYKIAVDQNGAYVTASDVSGVIYAVQTLRVLSKLDTGSVQPVKCFDGDDCPQYAWRGLHLDESRHFFGAETVKRLLELMSLHKLNTFHWHLTDDQGWRIEIKQFPLLTEIGSKRSKSGINGWHRTDDDGTPHEGFYTQEQIKEIVAYAEGLGIKIVPEIDMPAHFAAAFAAYSWLGCRDIKREVPWYFGGKYPMTRGIFDWNRSACIGNPATFDFIFKVIDEVCELFPAPYFHIGGDEAPKGEWKNCDKCKSLMREKGLENVDQLQGYFINEVNKYVESKGRRLIGWNEVLEGGNLDNKVIAQYWVPKRDKNVLEHLKKGGEVLMSKHQAFYFDMGYNQYPLKNTYDFSPYFEGITPEHKGQILGVEGELWTEWIATVEKLDLHAFPRVSALAERGWYTGDDRDYNEFLKRLEEFKPVLDAYNVNYAENEIADPVGYFRRKKETALWHNRTQDRELIKNRALKEAKAK